MSSPAEKLDIILEMFNAGLLGKKEAAELLGFNVKPKFKIGEKVWHKHGYFGIIDEVGNPNEYDILEPAYHLKGQEIYMWWKEEVLTSEYNHDFEVLVNDQE